MWYWLENSKWIYVKDWLYKVKLLIRIIWFIKLSKVFPVLTSTTEWMLNWIWIIRTESQIKQQNSRNNFAMWHKICRTLQCQIPSKVKSSTKIWSCCSRGQIIIWLTILSYLLCLRWPADQIFQTYRLKNTGKRRREYSK